MENKIKLKTVQVKSINLCLNIGKNHDKSVIVVNIARGGYIVAEQAANINSIVTTF